MINDKTYTGRSALTFKYFYQLLIREGSLKLDSLEHHLDILVVSLVMSTCLLRISFFLKVNFILHE